VFVRAQTAFTNYLYVAVIPFAGVKLAFRVVSYRIYQWARNSIWPYYYPKKLAFRTSTIASFTR